MGYGKRIKTSGTGKAGHNSSRWNKREIVKEQTRKNRRREDKNAETEVDPRR